MASSLKRTGQNSYTAMLAVKASPDGWAKPTLLLHFVERNSASTVFIVTDDAMTSFANCEQHRVYDVAVPGKCVRNSSGIKKYGVRCRYEVFFKYPCSVCLSKTCFPFSFAYDFCRWPDLNQKESQTFVDILGVVLTQPRRDVNSTLPKLVVDLGQGSIKQEVALLGHHAAISVAEGDKVAIAGVCIKEWNGERSLQTSFLSVVEVNKQLTTDEREAFTDVEEGPKRKAIKITPRTKLTIAEAQSLANQLLQDASAKKSTSPLDFQINGTLRKFTDEFFEQDPPILDTGRGEVMCWKTTLTDATGHFDVKVWDKACYELFQVTCTRFRELWEQGNDTPDKQEEILSSLNKKLDHEVTCVCRADVWTYGQKEVKSQLQVNVNALETSN